MDLNKSKSFKANKIAAYILAVLFVAATCGLAAISGSHSFTDTYDIGETCNARYGSISNLILSSTNEGNDYFWAATNEDAFNWNYLYIDIYDADFEEAFFEVQGYNGNESVGESIRSSRSHWSINGLYASNFGHIFSGSSFLGSGVLKSVMSRYLLIVFRSCPVSAAMAETLFPCS